MQATRRAAILAEVHRHGGVTVGALAASLDVAPITIRRDLCALADAGWLRRVHGGAVANTVFAAANPESG